MKIFPESIRAVDRDSLNASIRYSIVNGTPAHQYLEYFEMDVMSGQIQQLKSVDRNRIKRFSLVIKAEEEPPNEVSSSSSTAPILVARRFATAKLTVDVLPVDKNPPVLSASSFHGYVPENSPVGTLVNGNSDPAEIQPLKITVTDLDIVSYDSFHLGVIFR